MKTQLTLGAFIFLLSRLEPEAIIRYDFASFVPNGIDSYRGYYEQLAIGFTEYKEVKAADILALCRDAVSKVYTGWKGGEYTMGERTPLWVANRGETGGTAIIGLIDLGWAAIIETGYLE